MAALAFLLAVVVFVLAFLGVELGDAGGLRIVSLGLAFLAAGHLLPGAVAWFDSRRG